jgi:hypothetical protein
VRQLQQRAHPATVGIAQLQLTVVPHSNVVRDGQAQPDTPMVAVARPLHAHTGVQHRQLRRVNSITPCAMADAAAAAETGREKYQPNCLLEQ